jgi:Zn-dependent peptidase ImmA (M78 family)
MNVRRAHVLRTVKGLIDKHGIQPSTAVDVYGIARSYGIKIIEEPGADTLSGFLLRDSDADDAVIGVNKNHPLTRKRFTVAHELGHYLLHRYEGFHFDGVENGLQLRFRDEKSQEGTDVDEREANLFAAELLMPADFIRSDVQKLGTVDLLGDTKKLEEMAKRYKVSSQALTIRLTNLGQIA